MTRQLASVVVPAGTPGRNRVRASFVLTQDYRPIEVLVFDDGSRDGTPGVVSRFDNPVVRLIGLAQSGRRGRSAQWD